MDFKDLTLAYFTMNEEDAAQYAQTKLDVFCENADLDCQEIGDGNLNYVFKVVDQRVASRSLLSKLDQSLVFLMPLSFLLTVIELKVTY